MAQYRLTAGGVFDSVSNRDIPNDLRNADWVAYQNWLAEGNTPDPIDEHEWVGHTLNQIKNRLTRKSRRDARKLIEVELPDFRQRNGLAYASKMQQILLTGGTLTGPQTSRCNALELAWSWVREIRVGQNTVASNIDAATTKSELRNPSVPVRMNMLTISAFPGWPPGV